MAERSPRAPRGDGIVRVRRETQGRVVSRDWIPPNGNDSTVPGASSARRSSNTAAQIRARNAASCGVRASTSAAAFAARESGHTRSGATSIPCSSTTRSALASRTGSTSTPRRQPASSARSSGTQSSSIPSDSSSGPISPNTRCAT